MAIPQCVFFGGYSDVASVKKISHTDYTDIAFLQCVFLGGNKILIEPKSIITMTTLIYIFPSVYSLVMNKIYHDIHINTTCPQYVFDVMWQDFSFFCIIATIILLLSQVIFLNIYIRSVHENIWVLAGNI